MEQAHTLPQIPRRLSERRGKPELQPLDPILPSTITTISPTMSRDMDIESSDSSIPSGIYSPDNYATPAMSGPATPTDMSPLRTLALPFGAVSSIVGTSIREEEETGECNCQACEARCGEYGLGLAVGAVGTMGKKDVAFPRLDTVRTVREAFEDSCYGSHYHFNEKLAPVAMPPTPPSNSGENPFMFSHHTSPTSPAIDAAAFSSGPPSLPQSPKSEAASGVRKNRTATILSKVIPAKIRSLKRRMSGANESASNQPPPLPAIITMPTYTAVAAPAAPDTPPDDTFGRWHMKLSMSLPNRAEDANFSPLSSPEAMLPPKMLPSLSPRSPTIETESYFTSPLQSPRSAGVPAFARMCSLPETPTDVVSSPLYPPTISPLMSPSLASTSQTSLSASGAPSHTHKKVPSIDPATPLAPRKPAAPLTLVTANSLADMIQEMHAELAGYDATLKRMIASGWSSPREIRNVELQREEHQRTWSRRISESKKMLEGMRRTEVKHSAMSSVSSFDSFGSNTTTSSSATNSLPNINAYSFQEQRGVPI